MNKRYAYGLLFCLGISFVGLSPMGVPTNNSDDENVSSVDECSEKLRQVVNEYNQRNLFCGFLVKEARRLKSSINSANTRLSHREARIDIKKPQEMLDRIRDLNDFMQQIEQENVSVQANPIDLFWWWSTKCCSPKRPSCAIDAIKNRKFYVRTSTTGCYVCFW